MAAKAQDTLTVMQYNLLYYGNYQSSYYDCYETNNNTQTKDECIRTILNHVKPDILTVNEFGATDALQTDFMRHNLNINGIDYWKTDDIINHIGSRIINHIFYDSRKMELKKHVALDTSPRDTDVYELYLKTPGLAFGDTIKLVCIVAHLRSSMGYEENRRAALQKALDHVYQHYANENVLIMGDFNMYTSNEPGYQLLTQTYSNPEARFVDPLSYVNGVGAWNDNSQYAQFHTQSTHYTSNDCFVSGGLDDRFDFILMSDEIAYGTNRIRYANQSYKAVGNDGRHFNHDIVYNGNSAVPAEVAQALYDGSDHLPVTMKIAVNASLGVEDDETQLMQAYITPNPATNLAKVAFFNPSDGLVQFELYSLQGQLLKRESAYYVTGSQQFEMSLDNIRKGFYLLRLKHGKGWGLTMKMIVH